MIPAILTSNEITEILNNPIVQNNREKLSSLSTVKFSIQLSDIIKQNLGTGLAINLSHITSIPMRWIKGDTDPHIDRGEDQFNNTYLVYLTDSIGSVFIDGQSYSINAGDAHIFSEGIEHYTINTGDSERLMIGPMSETGFQVGFAFTLIYFANQADAAQSAATAITNGFPDTSNAIGYNNYGDQYTVMTVNDISSWNILTNTSGGNNPSPNGGPYTTGATLNENTYSIYFLYPYSISTPAAPPTRTFSMSSMYTNNAQVYYKPHSLSTGGGGSGVTNSRHKQRKT